MGKRRVFNDAELGSEEVGLEKDQKYPAHTKNKRREEVRRREDKTEAVSSEEVSEDDSSSSESEEELDLLEELHDTGFLQALAKAKGMVSAEEDNLPEDSGDDPENSSGESAENSEPDRKRLKKGKKAKPVLLKDVMRDEEEDESGEQQPSPKPYTRDLEETRRDFLEAAEGSQDEGEDLFAEREGKAAAVQSRASSKRESRSMQELLDMYFGKDEDLSKDDLFLKRFVSQREYADDEAEKPEGSSRLRAEGQVQENLEEDQAHIEQADRFEAKHNFRFEETGSGAVKTYPRSVEGVVRQADTRRAEMRARKEQKKGEERARHRAEVQRQKNLKRQEIEDRLQQVQKYSGLDKTDATLETLLASADFEGEEYDKAMEKVFGSNYYEAHENEDFGGDDGASNDDEARLETSDAVRATSAQRAETGPKAVRDAEEVQKLLQEYNKLDYEDIVAGMPTRFGYRQVEKVDYGLSTTDILSLSDKELNQIVGLKRMVPYREERNPKKSHFVGRHRLTQLRSEKKMEESHKSRKPGRTVEPQVEVPAEERKAKSKMHRLATFAKPQLKRSSGPKKEKPKAAEASPASAGLTKAQKRNSRRSRVRQQNEGKAAS